MSASMDSVVAQLASQVDSRPKALAASGKGSFCEYWPVAKPVLEALSHYLPGLAWVISLIIAVGDKVCGGK
jgi:hypothetical protein